MTRLKSVYRCSACGGEAAKWLGRCPSCGEWGALVEELDGDRGLPPLLARADRPVPIAEVDAGEWAPRPTGVGELDRVLGGGLVPGSVTLIGGEPGIGKSTLLLQAAAQVASAGSRCLYVTAEESAQQVRLRAERLGALAPRLWLASDTAVPHVLAHLDEVRPDLLVVDSVQTVHDPDLGSAPGTVAQVRECAARLVGEAKRRAGGVAGLAVVLVGHVTKDGGLAGPRVLEHVVDTVLAFEGDRHHALRLLRAVKHRFGSTSELGLFEMTEGGLVGVPDGSGLFLADRRPGVAGSVVAPTLEGRRPLLVEVQALAASSSLATPRRSAQGVEPGRLALLLAVIERRLGLPLGGVDVHALAVGGVRVVEPAADLPLALAVVSSLSGVPVPADVVACGEVGLGGELRQVRGVDRRLAEAARLGFTRAVLPVSAPEPPPGVTAMRAATLEEAVAMLSLGPA